MQDPQDISFRGVVASYPSLKHFWDHYDRAGALMRILAA